MIPSIDKGKHACQRVFPLLFALFALAGVSLAPKERRSAASARICRLSKPASQKAKITRKYIAARCGQFCRSRNVSRQGKTRREYCRIVKGLDAVWAHFCPSKPCLPLSIDGSVKGNRQGSLSRSITRRSDQNRKIKYCFLFCDFASACQKSPFGLF